MGHSPLIHSHAMAEDHPEDIRQPGPAPGPWFLEAFLCSQVPEKLHVGKEQTKHSSGLTLTISNEINMFFWLFIRKLDMSEKGCEKFLIFFSQRCNKDLFICQYVDC